jgi:hypothetical protein
MAPLSWSSKCSITLAFLLLVIIAQPQKPGRGCRWESTSAPWPRLVIRFFHKQLVAHRGSTSSTRRLVPTCCLRLVPTCRIYPTGQSRGSPKIFTTWFSNTNTHAARTRTGTRTRPLGMPITRDTKRAGARIFFLTTWLECR